MAAILDFETLMSFLWFLKLYQWIKRISKHNNCWFLIENILFMSNSKAFLIWPTGGPKMGQNGHQCWAPFFKKWSAPSDSSEKTGLETSANIKWTPFPSGGEFWDRLKRLLCTGLCTPLVYHVKELCVWEDGHFSRPLTVWHSLCVIGATFGIKSL